MGINFKKPRYIEYYVKKTVAWTLILPSVMHVYNWLEYSFMRGGILHLSYFYYRHEELPSYTPPLITMGPLIGIMAIAGVYLLINTKKE